MGVWGMMTEGRGCENSQHENQQKRISYHLKVSSQKEEGGEFI